MSKKWWFGLILIIIIVFMLFGVPVLINEMYKLNRGYTTAWGANDVLSFYGAILSFIGTVVLGALALWQSIKANNISEKMLKKELLEATPFIAIKPEITVSVKKEDSCRESFVNLHSRECTPAIFLEKTDIRDPSDRFFYEYLLRFSFQLCSKCQIRKASIITDSITLFETETPVLSKVVSEVNKTKVEMYTVWRDNQNFSSYIKVYTFNNSKLYYIFESGKEISIIFKIEYESTMGISETIRHQLWFRKTDGKYEAIDCNNIAIT